MNAFLAIITAMTLPMALMSFGGGVIALIWLLVIGYWQIVLGGLIAGSIFTFLFPFLNAPALGLGALSITLQEKSALGFQILAFLANLWSGVLALAWVIGVYIFFDALGQKSHAVLFFVYGFAVATGPIGYMAEKSESATSGFMAFSSAWLYLGFGLCDYFTLVWMKLLILVVLLLLPAIVGAIVGHEYQQSLTDER